MKASKVNSSTPPGASSVDSFCTRNGPITRSTLYNWWKAGIGPKSVKVGNRRLIFNEDEAEWREGLRGQAGEAQV